MEIVTCFWILSPRFIEIVTFVKQQVSDGLLKFALTKILFAMPKFCVQCGAPIQEGVRFCTNCGAPIAAAPQQPQSQPQPQAQQAYQQPQPSRPQPKNTYQPQKPIGNFDWQQFKPKLTIGKPQITFISKGKLIAIAIGIGILVLIALFSK